MFRAPSARATDDGDRASRERHCRARRCRRSRGQCHFAREPFHPASQSPPIPRRFGSLCPSDGRCVTLSVVADSSVRAHHAQTPGVYLDRVAGRHRHHRHPDRAPAPAVQKTRRPRGIKRQNNLKHPALAALATSANQHFPPGSHNGSAGRFDAVRRTAPVRRTGIAAAPGIFDPNNFWAGRRGRHAGADVRVP